MNDGGDDGDVDGGECWSNVKCPQFDIFSKGGLLQGWRFAREVVFSHPEVFAHKLLLRTEMFKQKNVHRHFSRQKCLRTEICAHTHKCLRTEFFTHRTFYTHKLLHAQFFAHISFYKLNLHCTQGNFYTEKSFTQRIYTKKSLYTKKPLRTKTVTRKSFYTEVFTHIGPHKVYTGKL